MKRGFLCLCATLWLSGCAALEAEPPEESSPSRVADAPVEAPISETEPLVPVGVRRGDLFTTKIDLKKAAEFLSGEVGPDAARARARLAIYNADCEGALGHLASKAAREAKGAGSLFELANRCAGATAGAAVVHDHEAGVWLRIQDRADLVLKDLLIDVSVRARAALEKDLGVILPRPLRIDLVRDHFSLSAVSGLPLEAAETTGTVAVARWGRVTMVSPRAMRRGFPWADTLAHEITHLLLSRATADRAPLWLQEGIAKREERRWREVQAFDENENFGKVAHRAQVEGKSVGVDAIGPSIAMLPSAEAASIAYAEVTDYMDFWIRKNGPHSLSLLLREMEFAADADAAMRGVSGFGVAEWQLLWRQELEERFRQVEMSEEEDESKERLGPRQLSRVMRLTELLSLEGFAGEAAELSSPELDRASHSAALRFLATRAALLSEREDVDLLLGDLEDIEGPHAGWFALKSAQLSRNASDPQADKFRRHAEVLDPLLPEVACGGTPWVGKAPTDVSASKTTPLCAHTRSLPPRGSR